MFFAALFMSQIISLGAFSGYDWAFVVKGNVTRKVHLTIRNLATPFARKWEGRRQSKVSKF